MRVLINTTTAHNGSLLIVQSVLCCVQLCEVPAGFHVKIAAAICVTVSQDPQEGSGSLADMLKAGLKKAPEDDQLAFGGPRYQATNPNSQVGWPLIRLSICSPRYQTARPPMPAVR